MTPDEEDDLLPVEDLLVEEPEYEPTASLVGTASLFDTSSITRTYELQKDGAVKLGDGQEPAYVQVTWYDRALTPDEIVFLRNWMNDHYT